MYRNRANLDRDAITRLQMYSGTLADKLVVKLAPSEKDSGTKRKSQETAIKDAAESMSNTASNFTKIIDDVEKGDSAAVIGAAAGKAAVGVVSLGLSFRNVASTFKSSSARSSSILTEPEEDDCIEKADQFFREIALISAASSNVSTEKKAGKEKTDAEIKKDNDRKIVISGIKVFADAVIDRLRHVIALLSHDRNYLNKNIDVFTEYLASLTFRVVGRPSAQYENVVDLFDALLVYAKNPIYQPEHVAKKPLVYIDTKNTCGCADFFATLSFSKSKAKELSSEAPPATLLEHLIASEVEKVIEQILPSIVKAVTAKVVKMKQDLENTTDDAFVLSGDASAADSSQTPAESSAHQRNVP